MRLSILAELNSVQCRKIINDTGGMGGTLYGYTVRHGNRPIDEFIYKVAAGMRDWNIHDRLFIKLFYAVFGTIAPSRLNLHNLVDVLKRMIPTSNQHPGLKKKLVEMLDQQAQKIQDPQIIGVSRQPTKKALTPTRKRPKPSGVTVLLPASEKKLNLILRLSQQQVPINPADSIVVANLAGSTKKPTKHHPLLVTFEDHQGNPVDIIMADVWGIWVPHQRNAPDPRAAEAFLSRILKTNRTPTRYRVLKAKTLLPLYVKPIWKKKSYKP